MLSYSFNCLNIFQVSKRGLDQRPADYTVLEVGVATRFSFRSGSGRYVTTAVTLGLNGRDPFCHRAPSSRA